MFRGEMPMIGQFQASPGTLEQRDAQELFESADLVTDGSRRHVQLVRSLGEAERARRGFKSTQ